jgi:hypothetical protein
VQSHPPTRASVAASGRRHAIRAGTNEAPITGWGLAKWLIPSIGGLCILLGYTAKFAHHALLGFDPGLMEPNEYLAASGDFFRWLVNLPFSGLASWRHALLDIPHVVAVWPAILLGIGIPVWRHRNRVREEEDHRWLARASLTTSAALLAVLVLRLVALDAPVARLEGALVANQVWKAGARPGERVPEAQGLAQRLASDRATSGGLRSAIAHRAQTLWNAKRCSRPMPDAPPGAGAEAPCNAASYEGVEEGEGLAQLLVGCMLIVLATRVLKDAPSVRRASLAWIAVFSSMLLAATFGKLGHSMEYEFALVGLKTSMVFEDPPATLSSAAARTANAAAVPESSEPNAATLPNRFQLHTRQGVVLHASKGWTTIAIDETVGCETKVKIWRISNSEILWERDIFRTDILSWSAIKTAQASEACPAVENMYGK